MKRALLLGGLLLAAGAVLLAGRFVLFPGPGPAPAPPAPEPAPPREPAAPPPVVMAEVGGTVMDEAGRPVAGADVYLLGRGSRVVPGQAPERGRTDAAGRFGLRRPLAEAPDLVVAMAGYRPVLLPAAAPGGGHRVVLVRGGAIEGAAEDDLGRPVAGAVVVVRSAGSDLDPERGIWLPFAGAVDLSYGRALTGPGGEFRVTGLGEGDLEVAASKAGWPAAAVPVVTARAGGERLQLVLPRPFVAEVTVFDADSGRPLPGVAVEVRIEAEGEPLRARGRTRSGGLFREALPFPAEAAPETVAAVSVFSERRGGTWLESVPLRAVAEGAGYRVGISERAPATLRLRVLRDDGTPEPGWAVLRLDAAGGATVERWTGLGPEGTGEVEVPAGRYETAGLVRGYGSGVGRRAVHPGGLDLAAGSTTDLTFTLPRGADVLVRLPEARMHAMVEVKVGDESNRFGLVGSTELRDLPPGAATITITPAGKPPVRHSVTLTKATRTIVDYP